MKTRQDAWTEENDLLLAETVLRHVREGSTQLNAFEEVGDKLNRTSAACGFRWNAVVRHQYEKALQLAKKQRKQRQRLLGKDQGGKKKLLYQPPVPSIEEVEAMSLPVANDNLKTGEQEAALPAVIAPSGEITLEKVIAFLQNMTHSNYHADILKSENARLKQEIATLKQEKEELEKKVKELEKNSMIMQEDYETLIKIMNRARKLVLFEDEEPAPTTFKMDRNGNLEKVAE
ncbi:MULTISPECIES: RsfA family transcriptional regulator [Bacillus]|jgi:prespore-specific regulator|uniref:RsfA family transcriptional regulator n=1 Tax=Bacillus TaxID=1386 RepID=UPI00065E2F50|nr:RsfA family transcriptional regulator [Bacillus smithii]AKP48889.1 Prespore specific transcriptional activator RsfA [Bacillus smithii]MED0658711.1 RsfA family transcriptional regulator [Bacillus smithii]MED1420822.1 RsfA family transcriptional regulator [Bacillus smithii]MED1456523.1 RsfA family transcriptional regulator [Bacillus smithii]MED1489659.1 RsfA family transcriptional regulator [Bacillus smithii]